MSQMKLLRSAFLETIKKTRVVIFGIGGVALLNLLTRYSLWWVLPAGAAIGILLVTGLKYSAARKGKTWPRE